MVKDFFKNMYNMSEEQRIYFAIEIDTFRLIALALSEKMTGEKGAIYIDFDSLKAIDTHIGKDITIPEGILLGQVRVAVNNSGKIFFTLSNNDLIAISDSRVAAGVLSEYKDKILSQKEMCSDIKQRLPLLLDEGLDQEFEKSRVQEENAEDEVETIDMDKEMKEIAKEVANKYLDDLENRGIEALYDMRTQNFKYLNSIYHGCSSTGFNLGHVHTQRLVEKRLVGEEKSKMKSFVFRENNGNYSVVLENSDLSWTRGDFLYHQQVDENLEETEVDQVAMKNLSLA